ncbi:methyl-accepting chemotaxis protein TlpC [Lysinibacillus alkalisoli]|uniref:Methyl-accepting chemotaxis protein TlpC n=1 Tax=Lysinibacillus alkalisoli TaxID=1911548 RepID=A0A917LDC5_9BACI|nr:methyl-accepting chemotaxis protein [Lysinibacillus alkalisoli]GGG14728.1 methyl-accepting chemotaxis protein TlpC [Lysinibacillus alkalisoli]
MSLRAKFNSLVMAFILLVTIVIGIVIYFQSTNLMYENYEKNVEKLSALSYNLFDERVKGDWQIKEGALYKGDTRIEEQVPLIDELGQMMDGGVTVFQDTKGLITTLELDGKRLTGKDADPIVIEAVMEKGETYIGEADVVGTKYLTLYTPIKNAKGEIIGMWFVGEIIDEIQTVLWSFITRLALIVAVVLLIAFVVSSLLTARMVKPLRRLVKQIDTIAKGEGDLTKTISITSKDEIGQVAQSFNNMLTTLKQMMQQIHTTAQSVTATSRQLSETAAETAGATTQINDTMHQVDDGSEQTVTSITESVTALQEMAIGVQQVAETTASIADATKQTSDEAEEGNEALQRVIQQMDAINISSDAVSHAIGKLADQSNEIGHIVSVITGIADQTNLLALNAAIEAARAGEQGKGFAVVANEVRILAEQSKQSADQIALLIGTIQQDTQRVMTAMEGNTKETAAGIQVVNATQQGFVKIKGAIDEVNTQVHEVSAVTEQMSAGVEEITSSTEAVAQISTTISDNITHVAAATEEQLEAIKQIDDASHHMAEQAQELQNLINRFTF